MIDNLDDDDAALIADVELPNDDFEVAEEGDEINFSSAMSDVQSFFGGRQISESGDVRSQVQIFLPLALHELG